MSDALVVVTPRRYAVSYQFDGTESDPNKSRLYTAIDKLISGLGVADEKKKPVNTLWLIWSCWESEEELRNQIIGIMRKDKVNFGKDFVDKRTHLIVTYATYAGKAAEHHPHKKGQTRKS